MIRTSARTETALWDDIRPHLRGRWYRTEFQYPAGLFDSFGLLRGHTIYLEHKIGRPFNGKPSIRHLRPAQHDFMLALMDHGGQGWVVFADQGLVKWYRGLDLGSPVARPDFVRHSGLPTS